MVWFDVWHGILQKKSFIFTIFGLKNAFLAKNGGKIQNFGNFKKVPLDILEIHVVSKFGPVPKKIVAGSLSEQQQQRTFQYPSIYQYTNITLYSSTNLIPTTRPD